MTDILRKCYKKVPESIPRHFCHLIFLILLAYKVIKLINNVGLKLWYVYNDKYMDLALALIFQLLEKILFWEMFEESMLKEVKVNLW